MRLSSFTRLLLVFTVLVATGCAKSADPKRPLEKIEKEVVSMSVADLESNAKLYAAAIRAEKAKIMKVQVQIQKMPIDKVFNNKGMIRDIAETGRRAEALFERYQTYVKAFQEKGGDPGKVQLVLGQPAAADVA